MDLGPPWTPPIARLAAPVAVLLLVTACSASPDTQPPAGGAQPEGSTAVLVHGSDPRDLRDAGPRLVLRSRVTRVAGHLSDVRRERVARRARATVEAYVDGAFAAGEDGPFARFQAGLRRAARADERVLAGPAVPAAVTQATAWLSVAAPEGRPAGVTARLRVDHGERGGAVADLTGRLLLTRADGDWQVFGYDLVRSGRGRPGADR
jgi:hypothetical protein